MKHFFYWVFDNCYLMQVSLPAKFSGLRRVIFVNGNYVPDDDSHKVGSSASYAEVTLKEGDKVTVVGFFPDHTTTSVTFSVISVGGDYAMLKDINS